MNRTRILISLFALTLGNMVAAPLTCADDSTLTPIIDELDNAIKKAEYKRIGVIPSFTKKAAPAINPAVSSPHGLYYAEAIQIGLVQRANEAYSIVDSGILLKSLRDVKLTDLSDLKKLRQIATAVGGLDAIVVGNFETPENANGLFGQPDSLHLVCKLLEIGSGTLRDARTADSYVSLADAVYNGTSLEILRHNRSGLKAVGLGAWIVNKNSYTIPFHPHTNQNKFDLMQGHPLPNPKCPYKVEITIGGAKQKLLGGVDSDPYVALKPGAQFKIAVRNGTLKQANVAIFVDGVNILGKRRELPDENCKFWVLQAGKTGRFGGFYSTEGTGDVLEPFLMGAVEDNIAVKQGFTEQLGMITVVFFNNGEPSSNQIQKPRRRNIYKIDGFWDERTQRWEYNEFEAAPTAIPNVPNNAVVPGQARQIELTRLPAQRGPILAAMTLRYATPAQIKKIRAKNRNSGF